MSGLAGLFGKNRPKRQGVQYVSPSGRTALSVRFARIPKGEPDAGKYLFYTLSCRPPYEQYRSGFFHNQETGRIIPPKRMSFEEYAKYKDISHTEARVFTHWWKQSPKKINFQELDSVKKLNEHFKLDGFRFVSFEVWKNGKQRTNQLEEEEKKDNFAKILIAEVDLPEKIIKYAHMKDDYGKEIDSWSIKNVPRRELKLTYVKDKETGTYKLSSVDQESGSISIVGNMPTFDEETYELFSHATKNALRHTRGLLAAIGNRIAGLFGRSIK